MKIHNKIIYLLIIVFVAYTLLFTGIIYYSVSNYAYTDFYKRLEIRAAVLAKIELDKPNDVNSIIEVGEEYLDGLPNQTEYIFSVRNDGTLEDYSVPLDFPQELIPEVLLNGSGHTRISNLFYSAILHQDKDGQKFIVTVSAENYYYTHHIAYLRNLLLSSLGFGILWIVFFAVFFSRTLIKPIHKIIEEVQLISSENLHQRLNSPEQNDSLGKLIHTFNDMLNRLETSFETQKNFISNASHELNTPLTSIIGEADLALSKERSIDDYKLALFKILEESEKLGRKTEALLLLAQTGYNGKVQKFDKVRIDQMILDVKEMVEKINPEGRISIHFNLLPEDPVKLKVKGNNQLLKLALSNIVLNACKYSNNKCVHVALGASDEEVIIFVKDSGIGIPKDELGYIYDPYYRASNTGNYDGYGIGLPLSRNIIRMHEGTLTIDSHLNEGTTVQINLPLGKYHL